MNAPQSSQIIRRSIVAYCFDKSDDDDDDDDDDDVKTLFYKRHQNAIFILKITSKIA